MVYFIAVWLLLLPLCLSIGLRILAFLKVSSNLRWSDRFILASWLGVLALSLSLMTLSLKFALSPWLGLIVAITGFSFSLSNSTTRQEIRPLLAQLSPKIILIGWVLALQVALFMSQQMIWGDSGLYHLSAIRWLGQFGAVPGIALVDSRLGFTSSWFALTAPFVFPSLGERLGGITNGFGLLLMIYQFWISGHQFLSSKRQLSDGFITLFFSCLTVILIFDRLPLSPMIISFSHDIPVIILTGVTAWAMLSPPYPQQPLIVLLFAIGTFTLKLSALPVLGVGILYYISHFVGRQRWQLKSLLFGSLLVVVLLLPNLSVSSLTSGCPLYPSQFLCWDLPWTVTGATRQTEVNNIVGIQKNAQNPQEEPENPVITLIQNRSQWLNVPSDGNTFLRDNLITVMSLWGLSVFLGILLGCQPRLPEVTGIRWVIFLGLMGSSFVFATIPLLRFGIGFLLMIPLLWVAKVGQSWLEKYPMLPSRWMLKGLDVSILIVLFLGLVVGNQHDLSHRLLLPESVPDSPLKTKTLNNFTYRYPINDPNTPDYKRFTCWATELPCSSDLIELDIELREVQKGLKSGFQFKKRP